MSIEAIVRKQRAYFLKGETKSYDFRMAALNQLETWIIEHEQAIMDALYQDLHKAPQESYFSEIGMVLSELRLMKKKLKKWMKKQTVRTPLAQFYSRSYVMAEPYGCVLIMAPWNYPFLLCIEPMLGAMAAGNCIILKPSAYAQATSKLLANMMKDCFDEAYITVIEGGRAANTQLLDQSFDFIFFTGSPAVGKLVMEKASQFVTPVLLELGGKSPCIVDDQVDMEVAAKRIVFGKFLNSGQTCVAPDYIFVQRKVHNQLRDALVKEIEHCFHGDAHHSSAYPKIINQHHYERLCALIRSEKQVIGGECNDETQQIAPTIVEDCECDSKLMEEEIFGPILPLLIYDELQDAITYMQKQAKPLALYIFSKNRSHIEQVLHSCSFGGGCVNDTIIHLASSKLPFGGVGNSGMGHYHGYYSFEAFSHQKGIVDKATWLDIPFRYHPYSAKKDKLIRRFLK